MDQIKLRNIKKIKRKVIQKLKLFKPEPKCAYKNVIQIDNQLPDHTNIGTKNDLKWSIAILFLKAGSFFTESFHFFNLFNKLIL